jgi:hypothetical protein
MSYDVTNALHDNTRTILRRMMGMWYDHYCVDDGISLGLSPKLASCTGLMFHSYITGIEREIHIPDVSTPHGLLDLVMVGTLLEMAHVISRSHYLGGVDALEEEEECFARWRYRRFCTWFSKQFVTIIGNRWVHPSYVFKRFMLRFCVVLVFYKREREAQATVTEGCTALAMEKKIMSHIRSDWPELMPLMKALLDEGADITMDVSSFRWTGPIFKIAKRESFGSQHAQSRQEMMDYTREPIYSLGGQVEHQNEMEVDE